MTSGKAGLGTTGADGWGRNKRGKGNGGVETVIMRSYQTNAKNDLTVFAVALHHPQHFCLFVNKLDNVPIAARI